MKTFDASVTHLVSRVNPDNFRPQKEHPNNDHKDKQNNKHGEHARLITPTEMASLNQQLQMPANIKE